MKRPRSPTPSALRRAKGVHWKSKDCLKAKPSGWRFSGFGGTSRVVKGPGCGASGCAPGPSKLWGVTLPLFGLPLTKRSGQEDTHSLPPEVLSSDLTEEAASFGNYPRMLVLNVGKHPRVKIGVILWQC